MMKKVILIILVVVNLLSCKENSKFVNSEKVNFVYIDSLIKPNCNYAEMLSSYKFVFLETNDNSLLGDIGKVITTDSLIFIMDDSFAKSIYCFTDDGRFLHKIGKAGRGPGEYNSLDDFVVDEKNQLVKLLDRNAKSIRCYDYKGKFIKSIALGFYASEFSLYKEGYLFHNLTMPFFINNKYINKRLIGWAEKDGIN